MKIVTALLLASALVIAGQAVAQGTGATLQDLSGKVLMNKGDGLVSGKAGTVAGGWRPYRHPRQIRRQDRFP